MLVMLCQDDATCPSVMKRRRMTASIPPSDQSSLTEHKARYSIEDLLDEEDRLSLEERGLDWKDFGVPSSRVFRTCCPEVQTSSDKFGLHHDLDGQAQTAALPDKTAAPLKDKMTSACMCIPRPRLEGQGSGQDQILDFWDRPTNEGLSVFIRLDKESDEDGAGPGDNDDLEETELSDGEGEEREEGVEGGDRGEGEGVEEQVLFWDDEWEQEE